MPARSVAMVGTVLVAALVASGCAKDSAGDFKGPQHDVAKAVEDFQTAATRRDNSKVCKDFLSAALVKQITQAGQGRGNTSCKSQVKDSLRDVDSYELQVKKVQISGNNATAQVKSSGSHGSRMDTLNMVREGRPPKWKIASLAG